MASPRSEEVKLGVENPMEPEEVRWCELKPKLEIKRTACIRCGDCVPTRQIASHRHIKEERIATPVWRSERLRGMKRKNYKEKTLEPKDYGDSDFSDDRSPSSWAAVEKDDNDLYYWEEVPKEPTPEGPNGGGDPDGDIDDNHNGDPSDDDPFGEHPMCCAACFHTISDLFTSVDECFQAMEAMQQRMEDLECVVDDDYKFLNRNVRNLFGMVANIKKNWCSSCGKFH
jgi:hypothetical protein